MQIFLSFVVLFLIFFIVFCALFSILYNCVHLTCPRVLVNWHFSRTLLNLGIINPCIQLRFKSNCIVLDHRSMQYEFVNREEAKVFRTASALMSNKIPATKST